MSRQVIRTSLKSWDGPVDVSVERLQKFLDEHIGQTCGQDIAQSAKSVEGYLELLRPQTEDGYDWFWAPRFRTRRGEVIVLLPWSQDWDHEDGSQSDRAPLVFTRGNVPVATASAIVQKLAEELSVLKQD